MPIYTGAISGSGDANIVGDTFIEGDLNISGTLAGVTTVSGSGAISSGGGGTFAGALNLQSAGITNAGSIAGATTVAAATSVLTPLIEYTDGDDAITIADGGGVTFSSTVKLVDDKTLTFGSNDDWTIEYDEDGDDDLVMTGTTFEMATDTATFTSANATDPLVIIKNTTNDTGCARLRFVKDKGSAGAANDDVGIIQFYGDDANQDQVLFGRIRTRVAVHTNGQEGGKMQFAVASNDGELVAGLTIGDGDAEDEVDVTIGSGADSLTTIAGDLDIPNGGFALGSDADGDIYYRNSNNLQRLAKGDDDQVLTLASGVPTWAAAAAGSTFTNLSGSGTLQAVGATTIGSTLNVSGNVTFGLDDTGVDVRVYSATTNEGILYDASEDELALLLTTKLKFHDVGGGEEIFASADGHLEINAATTLDITAPTVDINASTAVTIDGPSVVISSATSEKPNVEIKNTNADANGPALQFTKNGANVADNDVVGNIAFVSEDDGDNVHMYAAVVGSISDMTAGSEGGTLEFKVAEHDGTVTTGLKLQDGNADGEIDVTVGAGADSLTTIAGDLDIPNGGFALGSDASGDMYYNNASGVLARIAVGSDNHVLTLNGAVPGWEAASGGGSGDVSAGSTFTTAGVIMACDGDDKTIDEPGTTLTTNSQGLTVSGVTKVGASAGSGQDFFAYSAGTAAHVGIQWDADGNTEGTLIGGADDHGVDFIFYGETSGKYVQWDMSGDELVLATSAKLSFHDAAGGENILASADGHLEVNAGTTLDITAPTVDINASTAVTIDGPAVTIADSADGKPVLTVKTTHTTKTSSGELQFLKDAADTEDGEVLGQITFYGEDEGDNNTMFAKIVAEISESDETDEAGKLSFYVAESDGTDTAMTAGLVLEGEHATDGEVDATIGAGATSVTTVAGSLSVTTNSFFAGYTHYDSTPADAITSGVTATFTAGEDLEVGECAYFKSDGKMWKAVATAGATTACVAMAAADISADATGVFLLKGFLREDTNFPTWTVGGRLFTPEAETSGHNVPEQTAPDTDGDFVQVIGWAVDGNTVYFDPDSTIIEVA